MLDDTKALCKGFHSELFFPPVFSEERTAPESKYYELGKYVCDNCSQADICRELGAEEEHGLWGGLTPKERRTGISSALRKHLPVEHLDLLPKASPEGIDVPSVRVRIKKHVIRKD